MTAFIIAVVVGAVVAIAYVTLAAINIGRVRERLLAMRKQGPVRDDPAVYEGQGDGFLIKAGLGALASIVILVAMSVWSAAWYVVPFLAIGSAIAVVTAFVIDRD